MSRTEGRTALRQQLEGLAENLHWVWAWRVPAIFRTLDAEGWELSGHDPHAVLRSLDDAALEQKVGRASLRSDIEAAVREREAYMETQDTWGAHYAGLLHRAPVAYFSAEFGLHESLAIYSGGLGVLSGDHLKSASDLGLGLVGVGLLYRDGYFQQSLDATGRQKDTYAHLVPASRGLRPATGPDGAPVRVAVETQHGAIHAQVWEVRVGRIRLFLLDTDVEPNDDADRSLTWRLYGGDRRTRIRQELVLGVGGHRALRALGFEPSVLHLNEGHSAFAALEATAVRMEREGLSFEEAAFETASRCVFTTHTPVPAGHDRFDAGLALEHLAPLRDRLHLDDYGLLGLGRHHPDDPNEELNMTVLALRMAQRVNGVSYLHGRTSRAMFRHLYPDRRAHAVPIGHVTNGVHVPTWMAPRMRRFLNERLAPDWFRRLGHRETWIPVRDIPDEDLWKIRGALKRSLVRVARVRAAAEASKRGEPPEIVEAMRNALDEDVLTIGFARRFATYKRAALVFQDLSWLQELVDHPERPVRFVFAGKAHPADENGKRLVQRVFEASRDPRFLGKVVFLENYDMAVGRLMVQGVDVWLNNPRRPMEASGTSGQKVVLNGGLNCSVLDGWWAEGYDGLNGFAIGSGEVHRDPQLQDARDADALRSVLEGEVAPDYYTRDGYGLPREWLQRIKRSMTTLAWRFNTDRMLMDYAERFYLPAAGVQLAEARQ